MKHGRPLYYEDVFPWNTCHEGWRREHAHRVFAAIQSIVAWVDLFIAWREEVAVVNAELADIVKMIKAKGMIAP